jgi:hypothetical protein
MIGQNQRFVRGARFEFFVGPSENAAKIVVHSTNGWNNSTQPAR